MTGTKFPAAPGSIGAIRDEEWLFTAVEGTPDTCFVPVSGMSDLVLDTEAVFSRPPFTRSSRSTPPRCLSSVIT